MDNWYKCYDDSWKDIIVPEAFAHPAKMARGLTNRIFKHALDEQWIKAGDVVVDPFGGIGSTGIVGGCFGLQVVCVELEAKFCKLAEQNFEKNRLTFETFRHFGKPQHPVIIQGDSRRLSEVIAGADCVVGSPPFAEAQTGGGIAKKGYQNEAMRKGVFDLVGTRSYMPENQGQTPGQLGAMKPGSVEAIISSPPYANATKNLDDIEKWDKEKAGRIKDIQSMSKSMMKPYSDNPKNLGNLKPGEPVPKGVDAIVSSPPYEDGLGHGGGRTTSVDLLKRVANQKRGYGETNGQIENLSGETFWQAARQIVSECHKILKPGGHAIWVVKSFVRKGKIVDFPGDWRRLCEAQGLRTVCEHHAMLVKETRHNGLFEEIVETKERKSFFRRLAERKGSPKIDFEVVLCMMKV